MRGLPRTRVSLPATYPRKRGPRAWHTGVRQTAQRLGDRGRTSSRATQRHQPLARRTSLRPPVGTSARRGRTAQYWPAARAAGGVGWGEPARGKPASPEGSPPGGAPKGPPGGRGPPPRGAGAGSSPSARESTLVAKSASVLCIERETIADARAASSGENCGGGGSTSRAITHRAPPDRLRSPSPARSARNRTISLETRGARRGLATGAASGSVAGEGRLTGLAGAVAVGVAGPV